MVPKARLKNRRYSEALADGLVREVQEKPDTRRKLVWVIIYLTLQRFVATRTETPKAFTNLQPRVARASALPWGSPHGFVPTLKELRLNIKWPMNLRTLS